MHNDNNILVRGQESYADAMSRAYYFHMAGNHEKSFIYNKELAEYASKIGDLDVAERCYKRAIDDAKYLGRLQDEMHCLLNMTNNVYYVWGRHEEAFYNYQSLLNYYDKVNDPVMRARILNNIAAMHNNKGEYDQAMELYNQSLEIKRPVEDQEGISGTLHNIAEIHANKGEYDQAMELYNQSLSISKQLGDQQVIAGTLNNIGEIHANKGEYEEALSHTLEAYEILERLKSPELDRSVEILSNIKQRLGSEDYERLVEKVERDMHGSS
jgi:tetratricopeptide (TPR) repeat protein